MTKKLAKHYCIEEGCENKICYENYRVGQGRCKSCSKMDKNHPGYIDGRSSRKKHCIDCGKEIKNLKAKRCVDCYYESKKAKGYFCIDCGKEICYNTAHYSSGKCAFCIRGGKNLPCCEDCGKELSDYRTKRCLSCANKGKNNPSYIDGSKFKKYSSEFNNELKDQIRKRDNYKCQTCGITEEEHLIVLGEVLTVHHIDYDKKNCNEVNLITLCKQCNCRANFNREHWIEYFENKMQIKVGRI